MSTTIASSMPDTPTDTPTTMRAVVKESAAPGLTYVENHPVPCGSTGVPMQPGPGEVLVRVAMAGVCGTDRHIHEWDAWASERVRVGVVTGHELYGHIERIGPGVSGLEVGQRVSAEGHIVGPKGNQGHGTDFNARTGNPHIAREMEIIGIDRDGCFAEWIIIPAYNIWPVHDEIPDRWAPIFDPLGNAVHTVMEAQVSAKSVLITGVGAIGLMSVMVARAAGAASIFAVDIDESRLSLASELGADECFSATDASWVERVREATRGEGADALLEMSGHPSAFENGFSALRNGGVASLLGTPSEPFEFDIARHVIFKAATVKGIHGRRMFETWYQMENLLLSGRIDLDRVITHTLALEQINDAIAAMQTGEAIKPILTI
ncbi:MAG: zinc-binding dehydrogenase [Phycisphaerales bacterium JB043]